MEKDQFKCPGKQFTILNYPNYYFYVTKFHIFLILLCFLKDSLKKF